MLSLHEATHLRVHIEDILDEALEFTTTHLNSALPNLSNNPIEAQVAHALIENQPIHKGLTRLKSRHFFCCYEQDDSHNKVLLDFAKLDFNLLQKLHQRELSEFTRWWKELAEFRFCKRQSGGVILLDIGSVLRAPIISCYKDSNQSDLPDFHY